MVSSYPLYSGVIGSGQRWSSSLSRPPTKKEHKDRQACVYVCMREKNPCEPVRTGANRCEPVRIKYRTRAMLQCTSAFQLSILSEVSLLKVEQVRMYCTSSGPLRRAMMSSLEFSLPEPRFDANLSALRNHLVLNCAKVQT